MMISAKQKIGEEWGTEAPGAGQQLGYNFKWR